MTIVVTYDVGDDCVRTHVANLLGRVGQRVQESVFECSVREQELAELIAALRASLKNDPAASVRFYRLCSDCLSASRGIGALRSADASSRCIVI